MRYGENNSPQFALLEDNTANLPSHHSHLNPHTTRQRMGHRLRILDEKLTGPSRTLEGALETLGGSVDMITPTRFPIQPGDYDIITQPDTSSETLLYMNETWMELTTVPAPTFNEMSMIKTVVLSLMFVISLIGNTAALIQMFRMRRRRSTINTLILHLATADLIVTFFCNVTDAVWASTVQWYGGNAMCKMVKFLQVFGLYLSTYIIVIISVDRAYAILDPMSRNNAAKRVRTMIALAWILSALFALPQVRRNFFPLNSFFFDGKPIHDRSYFAIHIINTDISSMFFLRIKYRIATDQDWKCIVQLKFMLLIMFASILREINREVYPGVKKEIYIWHSVCFPRCASVWVLW